MKIETYAITPTLTFMDTQLPIVGYTRFIGAYLFRSERNAIVDVGPRAAIPNLLVALDRLGIRPEDIDYILLTHIHIDHAGGTGMALKEMRNARVVAHSCARSYLV